MGNENVSFPLKYAHHNFRCKFPYQQLFYTFLPLSITPRRLPKFHIYSDNLQFSLPKRERQDCQPDKWPHNFLMTFTFFLPLQDCYCATGPKGLVDYSSHLALFSFIINNPEILLENLMRNLLSSWRESHTACYAIGSNIH